MCSSRRGPLGGTISFWSQRNQHFLPRPQSQVSTDYPGPTSTGSGHDAPHTTPVGRNFTSVVCLGGVGTGNGSCEALPHARGTEGSRREAAVPCRDPPCPGSRKGY